MPFAGLEGRALFREALAEGTLEGYFALSEQFHTQAEPAFCGLGSLVVALNALGVDPGRLWKGPWRWFDETLLDCCVPLEQVKARGLVLRELACLAECNGAKATVVHASASDVGALRQAIVDSSRSPTGPVVLAAYDRAALGQTGSGHYSPIAGYHERTDRALVLDVARFKYPPHWVPVELLFQSMLPIDPQSRRSRGWISLVAARERPLLYSLGLPSAGWRARVAELRRLAAETAPSAEALAARLADRDGAWSELLAPVDAIVGGSLAPEHATKVHDLLTEVRRTPAFAASSRSLSETSSLAAETLAIVAMVFAAEEPPSDIGAQLRAELTALRTQLRAACDASALPDT